MNNSFGKRSPIALSFYLFIAISPPTSQIGLGSVLGKICPLHFYGMGQSQAQQVNPSCLKGNVY